MSILAKTQKSGNFENSNAPVIDVLLSVDWAENVTEKIKPNFARENKTDNDDVDETKISKISKSEISKTENSTTDFAYESFENVTDAVGNGDVIIKNCSEFSTIVEVESSSSSVSVQLNNDTSLDDSNFSSSDIYPTKDDYASTTFLRLTDVNTSSFGDDSATFTSSTFEKPSTATRSEGEKLVESSATSPKQNNTNATIEISTNSQNIDTTSTTRNESTVDSSNGTTTVEKYFNQSVVTSTASEATTDRYANTTVGAVELTTSTIGVGDESTNFNDSEFSTESYTTEKSHVETSTSELRTTSVETFASVKPTARSKSSKFVFSEKATTASHSKCKNTTNSAIIVGGHETDPSNNQETFIIIGGVAFLLVSILIIVTVFVVRRRRRRRNIAHNQCLLSLLIENEHRLKSSKLTRADDEDDKSSKTDRSSPKKKKRDVERSDSQKIHEKFRHQHSSPEGKKIVDRTVLLTSPSSKETLQKHPKSGKNSSTRKASSGSKESEDRNHQNRNLRDRRFDAQL